jgi:hypothetical protein
MAIYKAKNGNKYSEDTVMSAAEKAGISLEEFVSNKELERIEDEVDNTEDNIAVDVPENDSEESIVIEDTVPATSVPPKKKKKKPTSVTPKNLFGEVKTFDPLGLEKFTTPKKDIIAERINTWDKTAKPKKTFVGPKDKDYGSLYVKDNNKIGDYLTSTLRTEKSIGTFFGVEEEEGKATLEKLYAGIPGLTFEETNATSGDITNIFDAVKAVYIDPTTGERKESDILQFDIGVMNASAEKRPQLAKKNADILKDFFNKNLKNINLAKNQALREESKLLYSKELNKAITPEFTAEVNAEFDAPNLFTPRKEKYTGIGAAGGYAMGTGGGGSYIVRPYEEELKLAKKKVLADNPNIPKEKLNIEADKLARSLLKLNAINNKKAEFAKSIIENDKTLQSKLYVGSLLSNEEAVKVQNNTTTKLKIAENNALILQGLGKDCESILQGDYKTEDEALVIANKFKSVGIDMDINDTELLTLKNGNTITRGFYNAYSKLKEAYDANNLYALENFKLQNDNLQKLSDSDIFSTAASKNYDLSEKYLANIGLGLSDILVGASYFSAKVLAGTNPISYTGDEISKLIYGEDAQTTSGKLDEWAVGYTNAVADIRQSYVRDVSFKEAFSSGKNFGKFAAQEISQQIPILIAIAATGGAAGVAGVSGSTASTAMIGTFGAGGKMAQMQTEMAKGSADYSNTEIWLKSIGFGASEALFERMTTIPILKRANGHFVKFGGEDVVDDGISAYFKSKTPGFVYDQFLESAGETGTAITQNIIDGRPVMENVDHAAFSGFGMGTVMSGVPYAHGLYISVFSDYNSKKDIRNLHLELKDLGKQFELTKKRAPKKAIAKLMDAKQQEINIAIEKQQSKINENLRAGSAQAVIKIENEKAKLQNEAKSIVDDKSINEGLKELLIKDLRTKFNKLNDIKESALNPNNLMQDKSKFILLEASQPERYNNLIDQATTSLGQKGIVTEEIIKKEAYDLYLKEEIDINIENAGKVEGAVLNAYDTKKEAIAAAKINADNEKANNTKQIDIINKDENLSDSEKAKQIKVLEDNNNAIDNEFTAISTEISAGADGYKSASGIQVVVKENMLANQRTQIATHEVGHYVFDKIFLNNEKAFIPIANQLLLTTQKLDKKLYNKLIKNTEKDDQGNFKATEVISRFLEEVSSGDISFAEKKNSFLSGLFGSMIQKEFIDQYDFDFKGQTDMFNFVVGLGKKIKSGELTLKEIQEASESKAVKTAIELAETKKYSKLVTGTDASPSFSKAKVAEVEQKIDKLEDQYDNDDIEYDDYVDRLAKLQEELKKAQALPDAEAKPKVEKQKTEIKVEDEVKEIIKNDKGSVSSDKVQQIYESKGLNGADEIIKLFRPITNKIVNKRRDAPGFDEDLLRDEIETGEGGILYLIRSYKPEKGVPLAAYINKQLPLRAIASSRRVLDKEFSKDVTEEKALMAAEATTEVKEKPKYKNALESKVFSPEVLESANKKIITVIRTLKSRIDAPVSLNKTVTPLISEIRDQIGKQLDIDVKTAMGGKKDNQLQNWLLDNKQYVLENMTTTWLMGKDGQGGMPIAIQKQIDGKWVNYPDWVGKKIDREKTTTDNAGRTSGAELVRRLPNVNNNISDSQFLDQVIGPDGNPLRGRKESLAKAVAEEMAFDLINEDLVNEGPIYEALLTNQQRLGYEMANNFAVNFVKQSERGNVKFSKKVKDAQDILEKLPSSVKSTLIGINGDALTNFMKKVKNSTEVEDKFNLVYGSDSFEPKFRNKIVDAIKSIYDFYEDKSGKTTAKNYGINLNEDFESFANRKIFNALSKDQSLALTLNIPNTDLQWNTEEKKNSAKVNMVNFYNSAVTYLSKDMPEANTRKLFTRLFSRAFSYGKDQSLFDNQEGFFNAFLDGIEGFKIGSGEVRGRTILYNNEKVNANIGAYSQATSAKDISEFIESGDPTKINIEERKKISAIAKKDLKTLIDMLKSMYGSNQITNTQLGLIFKSLGGSMNSPLKVASELRYVAEKGNYSSNPKDWVYEHVPPSSYISRIAIGIITGKADITVDEFMDELINNSYVTILPKSFDKSVNEIYKSTMPFYYEIGDNPLIRYLDAGFNGKEVPAFYDLYDKKQISNKVVKDEFLSKNARNLQDAVAKSLTSFSKAPKGISVFDFDDTVGLTSGSVLYTMPDGTTGKLNAEEFAKEGSSMLDNGAVFDFSEFSKVVDGKPGPMVEKMKKMIAKFGPKNFFILTARPADAAVPIHQFLASIDINIPLENITGLGNSTAQAKADWMTAKAAEGYNDFYFADDAIQNVEAVKNALEVLDVKSKIQQARLKFSKTISTEFNKIIEENTGMENYKVFSDIVARRRGANKNKFDFYVPPSAADFELLLYKFTGKGILGEEQQKFFADALLKPYANGNDLMDAARQSIKKDYKALTDQFPDIKKKIEKLTPDGDYTYDQAIRVAMWTEEGVDIPGISQRDQNKLTDLVNNDPELSAFKQGLIVTGRQGKGWVAPTEYWDASTIISDLHNLTEGAGRKKFLAEFIQNSEEMFGKFENGKLVGPNINKVEAVYGTNVREALEDQLYRMINGKNKSYGSDKETSRWANWVNGSTGTIMFLNTRSAALQLLGAVNFLNLRDNNPFAAAAAFANQKQYWADFVRIWNSDKMKERRGGLKEDVAAAEIANAAAGSKNKANAVISYLLKIGYTPTQLADSFAIAMGGAPFYRNRIKSYLKEGQTQDEAEANAWSNFTKVSDETQQSGDPRDISKQQASPAGRLLLTFQNFSMQQARIVKKSFLDLKNGRGDAKTHVAKIVYYLTIQNTLFAVLQQGLFATLFDDDDEFDEDNKDPNAKKDKIKKKTNTEKAIGVADDVLDTILRGTGFLGGVISVLKNMYLKYRDEKEKDFKADYAKVVLEGANISPPIGSKLRKVYSGLQQTKFESDLIKERGWGVMQDGRVHLGPMYGVSGKLVEATTNVPMDRIVNKIENVSQALNSQNQAWQRIMVGVGFTPYSVGIEESKGDKEIRAKAKEERKEVGKTKRKQSSQQERDSIANLSPEAYMEFVKKRKEAREKKRDSIANLPPAEKEAYLKKKAAESEARKKEKEALKKIKADSIANLSPAEKAKYDKKIAAEKEEKKKERREKYLEKKKELQDSLAKLTPREREKYKAKKKAERHKYYMEHKKPKKKKAVGQSDLFI